MRKDKLQFKVYDKPCTNCLFTKNRLVSEERANSIINECLEENKHFICHKATLDGDQNICCKTFFDKHNNILVIRLAKMLRIIKVIPQPKSEMLPPYES